MKRSPVLLATMRRMRGVRADSESDSSCDAGPPKWRPMTPPLDESGNPCHAAAEFAIDRASLTANSEIDERGVSPKSPLGGLLVETPSLLAPATQRLPPHPCGCRRRLIIVRHPTTSETSFARSNTATAPPALCATKCMIRLWLPGRSHERTM